MPEDLTFRPTIRQAAVLSALSERTFTRSDLATRFGILPATMQNVIDPLVEAGFICGDPDNPGVLRLSANVRVCAQCGHWYLPVSSTDFFCPEHREDAARRLFNDVMRDDAEFIEFAEGGTLLIMTENCSPLRLSPEAVELFAAIRVAVAKFRHDSALAERRSAPVSAPVNGGPRC